MSNSYRDHPSGSTSSSSSSSGTSGKRGETSPRLSSSSKKAKIDDNENMSKLEFIEEFLMCSVCLDFPSSPIHSCPNAHVLCGQCSPKFASCPTCRHPNLRPTPLGEKLAKEANKKIQCANFEAGCNEGVLSTKFSEHLPLCYFREMDCYLCLNSNVQFHKYTKHLEDAHLKEIIIGPKFTQTYFHLEIDYISPKFQSPMKLGNHEFISRAQISSRSKIFFVWVSVLGDKCLADKYRCEIDIGKPNGIGCTWRLPILAYHEIADSDSEAKLSQNLAVLAIPLSVIRNWQDTDTKSFFFNVTYGIKTV